MRQNLERDLSAQLEVLRSMDLSHPTLADEIKDLVVAEFFPALHDRLTTAVPSEQ